MSTQTSTPTLTGTLDALKPLVGAQGPGESDWSETSVRTTALTRAGRDDYHQWLNHVGTVAGCVRPVRLTGQLHTIDTTTGEVLATRSTATLPDGVVYVPCGNRRAEVCPSCAELYRADTYHMIKSGLIGGKGTPDTVATHPAVFATFTAPSFGPVHTRVTDPKSGKVKPCRMRRTMTLCPHGKPTWCSQRHTEGSSCLGTPLCLDCYNYPGHAVWNAYASELWRRTTITLRRLVTQLGKHHGVKLDISFGKVAEYQQRGIVHFHAIIRLDQRDPEDPDAIHPPPPHITAADLDQLIVDAAATTAFRTPPHPGNHHYPATPEGWVITWGQQLVNRPLTRVDGAEITENMVAGYVAKYATKSTETTGFVARRITNDTISRYADYQTHTGTLVAFCWDIGTNPHPRDTDEHADWTHSYGKLRRWTHMLGFGGHFTTRSRRYGPTRKHLKHARRTHQRSQQLLRHSTHHTADHLTDDTTLIVSDLTFAGVGWLTLGDAELAATAAAKAREYAKIRKQESSLRHAV